MFSLAQNNTMASPTAFLSVDALALFSNLAHSQNVNLMNTLGNTYAAVSQWNHDENIMLGIGLHTYQRHGLAVSTSLRYVPKISMQSQGDVLQFYSPQFRNLTYRYDVTSHLLLVDNVLTWTVHRFQAGFIFGLGYASNHVFNYREAPLSNHVVPSLDHFTGHTQGQLAYELGVALDYPVGGVILECAYRYLNAGRGQLGLSVLQNTREHLSTGTLQYHAISLGVRFDYAH